mmetsp:Transcript_11765/g.35412  ORF Transcript_11765/g.35412 Transcript_11765/m.35412 type:complete len:259 (+) Transcript_11765:1859-2635(+)
MMPTLGTRTLTAVGIMELLRTRLSPVSESVDSSVESAGAKRTRPGRTSLPLPLPSKRSSQHVSSSKVKLTLTYALREASDSVATNVGGDPSRKPRRVLSREERALELTDDTRTLEFSPGGKTVMPIVVNFVPRLMLIMLLPPSTPTTSSRPPPQWARLTDMFALSVSVGMILTVAVGSVVMSSGKSGRKKKETVTAIRACWYVGGKVPRMGLNIVVSDCRPFTMQSGSILAWPLKLSHSSTKSWSSAVTEPSSSATVR